MIILYFFNLFLYFIKNKNNYKKKIINYLRILGKFIDALKNFLKYFGYQSPFNKLIIYN